MTQDLDFPLPLCLAPLGLVLIRLPDAFNVDAMLVRLGEFFEAQTEGDLMQKPLWSSRAEYVRENCDA